jgi:acetylglutamate synthase
MIVGGVELLRMIRDDEIKFNTKIKRTSRYLKETYVYTGCNLREIKSDNEIGSEKLLDDKATYEIIEEINIQAIKEFEESNIEGATCSEDIKDLARKYNILTKAIKQLDKKMKGE